MKSDRWFHVEDSIIRFEKGLYLDVFERVQPEGTYRDMQNGIFDLGHQSIQNEKGTSKTDLIPYIPIGNIVLNDGNVVIFSRDLTYSSMVILVDVADDINGTHTITINGTDTTKTDVSVAVTVTDAMTEAQTASAYVAALMADSTFLAEYRAEIDSNDTNNETVRIRTTNGTTDPDAYNTITVTIASSALNLGVWIISNFIGGNATTIDSAIGTFDSSGYTAIYDDHGYAAANKFNFVVDSYIEGTNRIDADLDTLIYWTDDNNVPRFANITTPISGEFDINRVALFPFTDSIPYFELDSVNPGGLLKTGAYYIAAAYVDEDGIRSNYFLVSPPIFINDETDESNPNQFDGAIPETQTAKSFTFTLTGLDTNHDYVRFAIIKNTDVSILPNVSIPNTGIISYTHSGTETSAVGDLIDITVNRIAYDKAKTMRQLDQRLYMGNLKGRTDIGYQRYANNIKLYSIQKEINGQNNLNYKDSTVTIASRSFRRDEVYAFYIAWVLTDGGESKAYHIPGRETSGGQTSKGVITFDDAPSSKNASSGTLTITGGPPSKVYNHWITINGTDTTKTDVTVDVVADPAEYNTPTLLAELMVYLCNQDVTFAAEYVASNVAGVVTFSTIPSVTDPSAYNTITISDGVGVGFVGTPVAFSAGVDSDTASFGAGPQCELDGANAVTAANISGQETGTSIATKMETAMNAAGAPWTSYTFVRAGATIFIEATVSGAYNGVLTYLPNGCTAEAGPVTATIGPSYQNVITVAGVAGTVRIDIDNVDYDEAYAVDADTTAAAWVATHQATLLALGNPIYVADTGVAEITLSSDSTYIVTDQSFGGMTATPVPETWAASGITGGGDYYDGNENIDIPSLTGTQDDDLTTQDGLVDPGGNIKLFHFSGYPDGIKRMGYWENVNEVYPSEDDWKIYNVINGVGIDTGETLEASAVRHHRFSENIEAPTNIDLTFRGTTESDNYYVQGFQLKDVKIPDSIATKVKGFKIYYAERSFVNKTILDQGLCIAGAENEGEIVTQNRASDIAADNLLSRVHMVFHPFKAMVEDTNVGGLSFVKAVANVNPAALTSNRAGITVYEPASGEAAAGLHTDGEPLVRHVKGKSYIQSLTDDVSIGAQGFSESNYKNGHGEKKLLIELTDSVPTIAAVAGTSINNYLMNLCMYRTDVYISFMNQALVWTGYWQEGINALSSGPADRQHSANETPGAGIFGGDTFIGWQTHKVHAERYTKILAVSGGGGTLGIDIDDAAGVVAYDEVFAVDADTTSSAWVNTHAAALAALTNPITATYTGTAQITLVADMPFTAVDGGATMTFEKSGSNGTASKLLTVSGGSGTLGVKIADIIYTEAFAVDADTTAANWVSTHATDLAALAVPVIATDAGSAIIKLVSGLSFKVEDKGGTVMSFTIQEAWSILTHDFVGESDYNIGMRHQGSNAWENYYPKSNRADVIAPSDYPDGIIVDEDIDNYWGYDPAFSAQANVKYALPFDGISVSDELPTRVIRSAEDIGGVDDTFREFLPTDFIDLPRDRGELIKLQAMGQVLIPHMERGLLRTRGREQLDTSSIAAFIGSGDIFAVSPDEIISTDYGYGGLQDQRASLITEHGYYFVDRAAGKVFLLTDQLQEISAAGMQEYFESNLDGGGILSVAWDPELRRIMLTKSGSSTTDFTISYLPETKKWISYHDYQPIFYVSSLTKLYSYFLAYMHAHGEGAYGNTYGTINEFEISFIENLPYNAAKQVAALIVDTTSMNGSTENRKDTFDKIQITNSYQDTGLITRVDFPASGWNSRRTKRTHKINQLRDTLNVAPGSSSQFPAWSLKKRLVDNFHKVRLLYSNADNFLLYVFNAELNLRPAKR